MAELHGNTVTALSAADIVLSDDVLLISEPDFPHQRNPFQYTSKSLAFDKLKAKVQADLSAAFQFGSMAYEDENSYSLISHNHNGVYNKVQISSAYSSESSDLDHLADIMIDRIQTSIYAKKPTVILTDKQLIGEIKLFLGAMPYAATTASDFDGWVYPDGSQYKLSDFEEEEALSAVFDTDGAYFTVPVLNNFARFNSEPYGFVDCSTKEGADVIPEHNHLIDVTLSGTASGTFNYTVRRAHGGNSSHGYISPKNDKNEYKFKLSAEVVLSSLTIDDSSRDCINEYVPPESAKTLPTYNNVAVMIYIGKRKGQS